MPIPSWGKGRDREKGERTCIFRFNLLGRPHRLHSGVSATQQRELACWTGD